MVMWAKLAVGGFGKIGSRCPKPTGMLETAFSRSTLLHVRLWPVAYGPVDMRRPDFL
jgi:hypothetical protein